MLGLKLRAEFLDAHLQGTAISLRTTDNQGAAQKSADYILSITYPTADVQTALKAISKKRSGCPIILMGERGRGKSHIMAVLHHAIQSSEKVESWLKGWGDKLQNDELKNFAIDRGFIPISEAVHNHEYFLLWNLLFDRHPKGQYFRGQFESMNIPFPPRTLMEKMFEETPVCLILDEFQTWYTGLPERDPNTGLLLKNYASNFIQILSEIAKEQPRKLILIISVLNNQNDAFQQVHRQSPVVIDFRGPCARQDRQKLLLHRLFENRRNIDDSEMIRLATPYASERFRLLHTNKSKGEQERVQQDTKSKKSKEPSTGINLSSCFETWGIASNQSIQSARTEFSGLTVQQIKQVLSLAMVPADYTSRLLSRQLWILPFRKEVRNEYRLVS